MKKFLFNIGVVAFFVMCICWVGCSKNKQQVSQLSADSVAKVESLPQMNETMIKAYDQVMRNHLSENGQCEYFLFDITGDKLPELWVKTGTCEADYALYVYTYDQEVKQLLKDFAGHSSFFQGKDYVIQMTAQMGYELWTKFTFDGKIVSEKIFEGSISGDEDYKYPGEPRIEMKTFDNGL